MTSSARLRAIHTDGSQSLRLEDFAISMSLSCFCRYITFCMDRVRLLRSCGVVPVVVFDGGRLPMKALEEASRAR